MLDHVIRFSLTHRLFVLVVGVIITAYGLFTVSQMPIDVFPDLNRPTVNIMTEAAGMVLEEVENTCYTSSRNSSQWVAWR